MKRKRVLSVGVVSLLCFALTARTQAFLGFGDIVFDPSNYAQAIEQVVRLERQYNQLVQSYQVLRSQYEQLIWNARRVPVDMSVRYRAFQAPWSGSSASDTYGTSGAWTEAINSGLDVQNRYARSTEPLKSYGAALTSVPDVHQRSLKTSYGTVELADGATQSAIETIGRLRANAAFVQETIQRIEEDSLSGDPEMNTEVAVLNKINASSLIALRTAQDANKLLVALAEQQALAAKRTRDAEARAINQHIQFMVDGKAVLNAQTSGFSDAMRAWRMP